MSNTKNRWVILKHTNAPDDTKGLHFDLLLEDLNFCRTWRLDSIPILNGERVKALSINPHRLSWLHCIDTEVSGGRGRAQRIYSGVFKGSLPLEVKSSIKLMIFTNKFLGNLEIKDGFCRLFCD